MPNLMINLNNSRLPLMAAAGIATAIAFGLILWLAQIGRTPSMALLYAGLDAHASGQVVAALDQKGVAYQVIGTAIEVDAAERDRLRMSLAAEGLPANGARGYELLDDLSGFGTTSQMFDAAYWRAKEGELARTIAAVPGVQNARVHIAHGKPEPFSRGSQPSASVTLSAGGSALPAATARALKHLVASAVSGLKADDVQIFETSTGLVATDAEADASSHGAAEARAESIRKSLERLLIARVGPGRSVVEVSVELITDREQITERRVDPDTRVAISSDTEESTRQDREGSADVTVASNLPDGDAGAAQQGQSQANQTRERVNYEVSQTHRELVRSPGGIRRMSVAVLIDGETTTAADGSSSWAPRSETELEALRAIISSAAGLDEARGDVLTLRSLELRPLPMLDPAVPSAATPPPLERNLMLWVGIAVAVLLAGIVLGLMRKRRSVPAMITAPLTGLAAPPASVTDPLDPALPDFALPQLSVVDFMDHPLPADDPASRLRRLVHERQAETIEILRSWLDPQEERA